MKIPRIPTPDGISGKAWSAGDQSKLKPVTEKFRANFDSIFRERVPRPGHTRVVYGKRPSDKSA